MASEIIPDKIIPPLSSDASNGEIPRLLREIAALENQRDDLKQENLALQERIRLLQAILFGKKSEKRDPGDSQPLLFNEPEQAPAPKPDQAENTTRVSAHARKKPGRKPLPADLPRVVVIHDLSPEEKECDHCHLPRPRIGEETSERLNIIPAKVEVIQDVRYKYGPCKCRGDEGGEGTVIVAPLPPQIIPHGIVTPGLLAHVIIAKYADAIPLYRQESQFQRLGLDIGRGTLCNWVMLVAHACRVIFNLLLKEVLTGPVINMDETTVQVLNEPGRSNTAKSFMWVRRGGPPERPTLIFQYFPTRSGWVPEELLKDYIGYLQTDGYIGYEAIGERPGIRHLGCWAHARRKFVEVEKGTKGVLKATTAKSVLDLIGKIYAVENKAGEQNLLPEQIVALREAETRPVLTTPKKLLDERSSTTPPKSLLGKAISYSLNQWERLIVFLEDGRLRPDNNLAENSIRPFALGRKNWMFAASPRGAEASAILFSIIETAKANGLEPYRYLSHLFTKLPAASSEAELKALLPQYIDRSLLSN